MGIRKMDSANDMKAHSRTYGSFIGTLKWSVPLIALIALFVVILISDYAHGATHGGDERTRSR